jgi:putative intracellular protease/amidase
MKTRKCYVFVFNGFADWEPALAIAGLQQFSDFEVRTVSRDGKRVTSMGNVTVNPDTSLDNISHNDVDLLLLPGGFGWEKGENQEITPLLNAVLESGKTVAAICGATAFLGQHGYLDNIKHTSNHPDYYLKAVAPAYKGRDNYVMKLSVTNGNMITASGVASVAFAQEIFAHFNLLENKQLQEWFHYFQHPELSVTEATHV